MGEVVDVGGVDQTVEVGTEGGFVGGEFGGEPLRLVGGGDPLGGRLVR